MSDFVNTFCLVSRGQTLLLSVDVIKFMVNWNCQQSRVKRQPLCMCTKNAIEFDILWSYSTTFKCRCSVLFVETSGSTAFKSNKRLLAAYPNHMNLYLYDHNWFMKISLDIKPKRFERSESMDLDTGILALKFSVTKNFIGTYMTEV